MNVRQEIFDQHALLYRVGKREGSDGLWYDQDGNWTGKIHKLKDGAAAALPMGPHPIFRADGHRWISVTDSLFNLRRWFSESDMRELLAQDYQVFEIEVFGYRRFHFETYSHEVCSAHQTYRTKAIDPALLYPSLALEMAA